MKLTALTVDRGRARTAARVALGWRRLLLGTQASKSAWVTACDGEVHVGVAQAAELGALAGEGADLLDERRRTR